MNLPQYLRRDLFRTPDAIAMTKEYLVNGRIIPHSHDFVEVVLVISGSGLHRSREGEIVLRRGDLLIIRPGAWHTYEECQALRLYNCCFGYELLSHELAWFDEDARLNYLFQGGPLAHGRHGILATRIREEAVEICEGQLLALCGLEQQATAADRITTLAGLLHFFAALAQSVTPGCGTAGNTHPAVIEAIRLLAQDVSEAWSMTQLAERVGLSAAYLSRLFREQIGVPPMTYLHQQRMEEATNLLLHTDWPILHIALHVGFSEQNYFARCFKTYYGLSPTQYRKQFATHRR